MCAVSMIGDHYTQKWNQNPPNMPFPNASGLGGVFSHVITRAEFEALKKEVLEMKELLRRAKEYDERTGQPNCEMEEKIALLKKVAEAVGVKLDDIVGDNKKPIGRQGEHNI